jgi:UDP-hydrolysing UDP-N-acetyl-D-glucosamine 2-epimerase
MSSIVSTTRWTGVSVGMNVATKRRIGIVSVARSDYGIYRPLLTQIRADSALECSLYVASAHLSPEFGCTVKEIERDGFPIAARLETLLSGDSPEVIAHSMARGVQLFGTLYARERPDILVVLGDRFDMYVSALAALPFNIPVAHIHGGEVTTGAIDDALRHSLTKISHLHFTATDEYARRVRQLGEEDWRISVSGALSLDNLEYVKLLDRSEIAQQFGLRLPSDFLLVTLHPVTLSVQDTSFHITELLAALRVAAMPVVFTLPNADSGNRVVVQYIREFVGKHENACLVGSLGTQGYFSLMNLARAMVGNSSSGIIEAPSFRLPVVNVGCRQDGRTRGRNVIDCDYQSDEITNALRHALSHEFKAQLCSSTNPYKSGVASTVILERLKSVELNSRLLMKKFVDRDCILP